MKRDNIFSIPGNRIGDFVFDETVAEVFPDMIARSVPGYGSILSMIGQLAERFATADSNIYDLGCSLGAASLVIRERVPQSCRLHAIDNSPAMIDRLGEELAAHNRPELCEIILHQADILGFPMSQAAFCVLNFTLQFVPVEQRPELLQDIQSALLPGGALLLSEKTCAEDEAAQKLLGDLHHEFKRANGYSELEIAQKRTALENTLIPETLETHLARLHEAGFDLTVPWFQCFNFVSILAIKMRGR